MSTYLGTYYAWITIFVSSYKHAPYNMFMIIMSLEFQM